MSVKSEPSLKTSGWASYVTFDADLDPVSISNEHAKILAHGNTYPAHMKLVESNRVRVSPVEKIDAGEFYIQLEGLQDKNGAKISCGKATFGPASATHT